MPGSETHAGDEIIIAKAGKPYAKLIPLQPVEKRTPGIAKGALTDDFFDPLSGDELAMWES